MILILNNILILLNLQKNSFKIILSLILATKNIFKIPKLIIFISYLKLSNYHFNGF